MFYFRNLELHTSNFSMLTTNICDDNFCAFMYCRNVQWLTYENICDHIKL